MRMIRGNGKDIYRRKAYTPKFQRRLDEEYKNFIEEFKKVPKEPPVHIIDFIRDKFGIPGIDEGKNLELKIIVFCKKDELREILIDLGNKGANLQVIYDALKPPDVPVYLSNDDHPFGLELYGGELLPSWNQTIEKYTEKKKAFGKDKRILKAHIKFMKSLEPIPESLAKFVDDLPIANASLKALQDATMEFERWLIPYLNGKAIKEGLIGYPAKWGLPVDRLLKKQYKLSTQKTHGIWNRRIKILVDELKRIGFSDKQAYTRTAKLLNLAFPHLYRDTDPDLVRQRYSYQKKLTK
jgi:hypothetical protein